jgi:GTPase SAR1 family protein
MLLNFSCACSRDAGQEKFRQITNSYYRGAKIVFIVYDISKEGAYDQIKAWLSEATVHLDRPSIFTIIGNKSVCFCEIIFPRINQKFGKVNLRLSRTWQKIDL